jgi:uncharacterized protein YbaR (Trm112 family)
LESFIKHTNDTFELKIFSFVCCPVCKQDLENINKRITRSDTYNYRFEYVLYMLHYYLVRINSDIANDIDRILKPVGAAVLIEAQHFWIEASVHEKTSLSRRT